MSNMKNSTAAIGVACAIVFIIFVFSYVYHMQTDLFAYAQHVWSGGKTRWNGMVGALLITIVAYIVHNLVKSVITLPHRVASLSYLPSFILLGVLTSLSPDSAVGVRLFSYSTWIGLALFPLSLIFLSLLDGRNAIEKVVKNTSLFGDVALLNYALLALGMLLTIGLGNTDRAFHERLAVERMISERDYDGALRIAQCSRGEDASVTMFTALALSKKHELGESLFEYPIVADSRALLPVVRKLGSVQDSTETVNSVVDSQHAAFLFTANERMWRNIGGYPKEGIDSTVDFLHLLQRRNVARPAVPEYILTAYLMDCDLTSFASEIVKYYDITEDKLPKHFREALVLYTHIHSQRVLTYHSSVLDADYEDFLKVDRGKYATEQEHDNALRNAYFGTYWYYHKQKSL